MADEPTFEATLAAAERIVQVILDVPSEALLIGGLALAVHYYPRDTVDLDLATAMTRRQLQEAADRLRALGMAVDLHPPDAADPLGGVIDVRCEGADPIQIVNFLNEPAGGFPRLVKEANAAAREIVPGSPLRVVALPHLVAFKLYAGGRKSELDILELLDRNPDADIKAIRSLCASYRLAEAFDMILARRALPDGDLDG